MKHWYISEKESIPLEKISDFIRGIEECLSRAEFVKTKSQAGEKGRYISEFRDGDSTVTHISVRPTEARIGQEAKHTNTFFIEGLDESVKSASKAIEVYSRSHGYAEIVKPFDFLRVL